MPEKYSRFFPAILLIFHVIGLFLFINSDTASDLTWLNLLLCGTLVFLTEWQQSRRVVVLLIISLGGFLIELIGTKTGVLFGDYAYGSGLGWRLFGVSIIIAVNWYAIVLAGANVARLLNVPILVQSLIAALLCVGLDFAIEPVAIKYDFWSWTNEEIPLFNYITWYIFGAAFSYLYLKNSRKLNKTALSLFFIWLLFFATLNFI